MSVDAIATREATERFAALEADQGQSYEGRVELAREVLRWAHETFGDRHTSLVALVHQGDPAEIEEALRGACLNEVEFAAGQQFWSHFPDAKILDDGLDLAYAIESLGYRVAYTTTRSHDWKDHSKDWLRNAEFPMERSLLARMKHQRRLPASIVKIHHAKVFSSRLAGAPLVIVDDEQTAVDALTEKGYTAVTKDALPQSITALRAALDTLFAAAAAPAPQDK